MPPSGTVEEKEEIGPSDHQTERRKEEEKAGEANPKIRETRETIETHRGMRSPSEYPREPEVKVQG